MGELQFSATEELVYAGFLDDIDPSFILAVSASKPEHSSYLYIVRVKGKQPKPHDDGDEHDEERQKQELAHKLQRYC